MPLLPGKVPVFPRAGPSLPFRAIAWLAVLAWVASPAMAAEEAPPETWSSEELGVRLKRPRGWALVPGTPLEPVHLLSPGGVARAAVLALPLTEGAEGVAPDLEELTDQAVASLEESIAHFKLLSRREATIDGNPAMELYFRGKISGTRYRWVQNLFVQRDRQVILMYTAPEKGYLRFLADYDQILRSVRLVP